MSVVPPPRPNGRYTCTATRSEDDNDPRDAERVVWEMTHARRRSTEIAVRTRPCAIIDHPPTLRREINPTEDVAVADEPSHVNVTGVSRPTGRKAVSRFSKDYKHRQMLGRS